MSESESEEFAKKLTALLKERDSARVAIFDLHMAVSKAEEMRDRGVESAKAAGSKILELQGELSALKTELGAASLMLKGMVERAETSEKRAIALQSVVERVREEISKAEKPEITEEQLEASRKSLEGSRVDPTTGDILGRGVTLTQEEVDALTFDEADEDENYEDENYDDWGLAEDVQQERARLPSIGVRYGQKADETSRRVLKRRAVSLAPFGEALNIVKILGVVSYLLGVAIIMTSALLLGVSALFSSALVFMLTFGFASAWGVLVWGKKHGDYNHMRDEKILLFDEFKNLPTSIPLVKPILRKKEEEEVPPPPADDTGELDALTQEEIESMFGDPDEDGGD